LTSIVLLSHVINTETNP